jgi:hypothetical protein
MKKDGIETINNQLSEKQRESDLIQSVKLREMGMVVVNGQITSIDKNFGKK